MARPDSLEPISPVTPARFGHSPALWLACPLLLGCAADVAFLLAPGLTWVVGAIAVAVTLLFWRSRWALVGIAVSGLALGASWHHLSQPPQTPITPTRHYVELPLRIERASPKTKGEGWIGFGVILDRDGGLFRRRVVLSAHGECPADGAELVITGRLDGLPLPAQGYTAWALSQGATLRLGGGRVLGVLAPPSRFSLWCQQEEQRLERWLRALPWEDHEGGALLAATMLGRTALLPDDVKTAFARTGTLHLFAISGLHIAGMAAALLWLAQRMRLPGIPAGVAILALLWLYVQITGASPSAMRAWIMAAFIWAGQAGERTTPPLQSLALACAVTLLLNPGACRDPGFQLSYLAVLALIAAGGPAAQLCTQPTAEERLTPATAQSAGQKLRWRARQFFLGGICISSAASLAGAPLTLSYFGSASLGGIALNLVLVPLSEIPLVLGMASISCSVSTGLTWPAVWLNGGAALCLHAMTWCAEIGALLPGTNLQVAWKQSWLGPVGGLLMATLLIAQCENRQCQRLLGGPLLLVLGWLLLGWALG